MRKSWRPNYFELVSTSNFAINLDILSSLDSARF